MTQKFPAPVENPVEKVDNRLAQRRWGLGIFAKAALPGQVKTRLCPPLAETEAAVFYHLSLAECVRGMAAGTFDRTLFMAGEESYFRRRFSGISLRPQGEGDLGERMDRALRYLLRQYEAAVLIGSDAPDLPAAIVQRAFRLLDRNDFVTAPARDGGYVLVGCRRPCPEMFAGMVWSTPEVLTVTRRRAAALGLAYAEVPGWDDVDDFAALGRLLQRSPALAASRYAARLLSRRGLPFRQEAGRPAGDPTDG